MKYMGGKYHISKYIVPIMLAERKHNQYWVEPFVGGGNIITEVDGLRIGADINPNAIQALISIRDHVFELPKTRKEFTELDYKKLKSYKHAGYAGFCFSFGGKWLGGYCKDTDNKRDYIQEAYFQALIQHPKLQGVQLLVSNFIDLQIPPNSLIYCDPPYANTTDYKTNFDSDLFWEWCRIKSKTGHTVFISEYMAPDDFECIWLKNKASSLTLDTGSKIGSEKLFKFKG